LIPRLVTQRLVMRGWHDDDRAPYAAINADPAVMEHFPGMLTFEQSSAMVDRMMSHWADNGFGLWAVENAATTELIGFVGLMAPAWEMPFTPCVEVGWRLAQTAWGNGFAPEAAEAALAWGFENVDLPDDEIVSFTTVANAKSRRVMEKLGLTHDELDDFDHPMLPDWAGRRHVLYRINRHQFEASRHV
jgi:ribosomal-protein-alanine N-acetyltransferase